MRVTYPTIALAVVFGIAINSPHGQQGSASAATANPPKVLTQDQIQTYRSYARERINSKDYETAMATLYFLLNADGLTDIQREEIDTALIKTLQYSRVQANPNQKTPQKSVATPALAVPAEAVKATEPNKPDVTLEQFSITVVESPAPIRIINSEEEPDPVSTAQLNEPGTQLPVRTRATDTAKDDNSIDGKNESQVGSGTEHPATTLAVENEMAAAGGKAEPEETATVKPPEVPDEKPVIDADGKAAQNIETESTQDNTEEEFVSSTDISAELSFSRDTIGNTFPDTTGNSVSATFTDLSLYLYHYFSPLLSGYLELSLPVGESGSAVETDEFWLQFDLTSSDYVGDITLGTQSISESRGWMFDSTLDLISTGFSSDKWNLRFGIGIETQYSFRSDFFEPEEDPLYRWLGEYSYRITEAHQLSFFMVGLRDQAADEDNFKTDVKWFSARASGTLGSADRNQFEYWADLGVLSGDEKSFELVQNAAGVSALQLAGETTISGEAYDAGVTWLSNLPGNPQFTIAIAGTSGDSDQLDSSDESYRQTGLQGNSADIGSASGLSYYGLALDPELSNLKIRTAGVAFPLMTASYIAFMYHDYQQVSLSPALRDSSLDLTLTGGNKDVGMAVDLVFAYEESQDWSASLSVGLFKAGKGTEQNGSSAFYGLFDVSHSF